MKTNLMLASALMLSVAAVAGFADDAKKPAAKTEIKCAVMSGKTVKIADATKLGAGKGYADYKGNRYFFCCGGCPSEFAKDPAKFAKADHIPTPKVEKTTKKG